MLKNSADLVRALLDGGVLPELVTNLGDGGTVLIDRAGPDTLSMWWTDNAH